MAKGSGITRSGGPGSPRGLQEATGNRTERVNSIGVRYYANDIENLFYNSGTTKVGDYTVVTRVGAENVPNGERGLNLVSGMSYRIYNSDGKMVSFGSVTGNDAQALENYRELIRKDIKEFKLK